MTPISKRAGAPRRASRRPCGAGALGPALALVLAGMAGPLHADERGIEGEGRSGAPVLEPEGVPAGKPYQVRGVIEWIDLADNRMVVDGTEYYYNQPRVHPPPDARAENDRRPETPRLRPGMTVGLNIGRGDPRPVLEVWVLR